MAPSLASHGRGSRRTPCIRLPTGFSQTASTYTPNPRALSLPDREAFRLTERTDFTPRAIVPSVLEELGASRAVGLIGSRQVGKTTLARRLLRERYPAAYVTMDDDLSRAGATLDPVGFIAGMSEPTIIDEIQRVPALMLALKQRLDTDDRRGRFLITGSANIAALPTIRDALPGRVVYLPVWPLAQAEIEGTRGGLVDDLFDPRVPAVRDAPVGSHAYTQRIAAGGYPDAFWRTSRLRARFFGSYVESIVDRDVPDVAPSATTLRSAGSCERSHEDPAPPQPEQTWTTDERPTSSKNRG